MTESRWADVHSHRGIAKFDGDPAVCFEDDGYGVASFYALADAPLSELVNLTELEYKNSAPQDGKGQWLELTIDYTDSRFFEEVASGQYVRPSSGIEFTIERSGEFYVCARVQRESPELTWSEMELLLTAWATERSVKFDELRLYHDGHPHNWEAYFIYPDMQHSVRQACDLVKDAIGFVSAYESGEVDRESLAAILRSGQASLLVGMTECAALEIKRPLPLADELARFEIAKDIVAMANSSMGGVLVIGAATKNVSGSDVVKRITPVIDAQGDVRKLQGIVSSKIYPPLAGLDIRAVPADEASKSGHVVMIDVPPQPVELKPILLHGESIGGGVRNIFVSVPIRDGDGTAMISLPALHARLVAGSAWLASQSGGDRPT